MNRGLKKNKDPNAVPQVGSARSTHFAGSAACSDTKCGIPSCCRHDVMSGSPYSGVGTQPNQITIPYHTIPYDTITYHCHYHPLPITTMPYIRNDLARLCCPALCRSLGPTTKRISRWAVMDDVCIFGLRRLFFSRANVPICYERGRQTLFGLWKLSSDLFVRCRICWNQAACADAPLC